MYTRVSLELAPATPTGATEQPQNQRFDLSGDPDWIIETVKSELARTNAAGATIQSVQVATEDNTQQATVLKKISDAITAAAATPGG